MTHLSQYWSGTLTEGQRKTWREYAGVWRIRNRLGQSILLQPHCHFIRCNFYPYLVNLLTPHLVAPPGGPTHIPSFTFTADGAADRGTVVLPPTNYDPLPDELDLYLSIGKEVSIGVNYYSTPWRYSCRNHWNGSAWTNDPWIVSTPWPITHDKKLFCRLMAALATGETSGQYQCSTLIA